MAWFKVDDGLHSARKLMSIPRRHRFAAIGLWAVAGSWCADQLTDGHVPDYMIDEWSPPPSAASALVDSGLWERESSGFAFRNWDEYQPSRKDVEAERAASRDRMREIRARRKQPKLQKNAEEPGVFGRTGPNGSENVRNPDPTRPDPTPKEVPKGTSKRTPEKPLPEAWEPNGNHASYAMENRLDLAHEAGQFRAHAAANDRRQRNWDMAFRTWLGNAAKWSSDRKPNAPTGRRVPSNEEWMYR